jgi:hypothetical protein
MPFGSIEHRLKKYDVVSGRGEIVPNPTTTSQFSSLRRGVLPQKNHFAELPVFDASACAWPARAAERTGHLGDD